MTNYTIEVKNLNRSFRLPHERRDSFKEKLFNFFRPSTCETIYAARDLTFSVPKGEFLGIIGDNGAGKSTLLKLLSGIIQPDSGEIKIQGRIAPFIELEVGFQQELTGRDNVFLYGALLGMTRNEMEERYDAIVRFAELERFMDQKVKNYSTGMKLRLGFAITSHADADLIFIDEVLAVGDASFQLKCYRLIDNFVSMGKTVLFVSHDTDQVKNVCSRALWIHRGRVNACGKSDEIVNRYNEETNNL